MRIIRCYPAGVGIIPCGLIHPLNIPTTNKMNAITDNVIRTVRRFTVRFELPLSLTRLNMLAARLSKMRNKMKRINALKNVICDEVFGK